MKINKLIGVMLIFSCIIMLNGCKKNQYKAYSITYFDYFDTVTTIIGYEKKEEDFNERVIYIENLLKEYHRLYDIYDSYVNINNLYTLNQEVGNEVVVDQKIIDLLNYAIDMYNQTSGMMNIAMGSVLKLWHDEREYASYHPNLEGKLPLMSDLEEAAKHTNILDIVIDDERNTVLLKDKLMRLDVGAIAKGYATEEIAKKLQSLGVSSYMLNVGGNIRLIGSKASGEKWKVGIQDPDESATNNNIAILELQDFAIVTSGSYQRYYYVDGVKYHHIIDPKTLMPENKYVSVSVVAKNSALADALSTALFNLSLDDGKALIQDLNDVYVMWIDMDNQIHYSSGFENFLIE
ncbi:MAG: FAD:protein FMN transferase [Staphylococcus sp.]|nr:FAD:protein FMN transferase [Staphylococcus sp.]